MIRLLTVLFTVLIGTAAVAVNMPFEKRVTALSDEVMTDPAKALHDAETLPKARWPSSAGTASDVSATSAWLQAEALVRMDRSRDAFSVASRALRMLPPEAGNENVRGDLVLVRGVASELLGRVADALRDYQAAYILFNRANRPREQSKALLQLGILYFNAGDHENALRYFEQAIGTYSSDKKLLLVARNSQGNDLFELRRYKDAEQAYQQALALVGDDMPLESLILRNIAGVQAQAGELDAAQATLQRAAAMSRGGSASDHAALNGVGALIALRKHDLDRAAALIDRTFAEAQHAHATLPMRDYHRTAYEIYRERGEDAKALAHLEAFKQLDDQDRALTASTSAALMHARFDFANQETKIAQLHTEQTKRDLRFHTILTTGLLTAAGVISTLLLIGFLSIRRSRNQVRAANATLRGANTALEKALAAKTEFLATTSHEIRTPLNGILGMTQVILAGRALDPSLRERIELLHGAGETMRALVDDILDVAKMETGELRIHPAEMDLRRLLEDAAQVWTGQAETKRIGIELRLDDCPARIVADEVRLRQIIFNLMSNAIKFTDRGRVRLSATGEMRDDGKRLVITVDDTGIGIPQDRIDEIFESFRQVDGGTTRRHGGTGLGLAICRSLARAMGGDVIVASTVGAGSNFTLDVPLLQAEARGAPAGREIATSLATAELLVIEPNPLSQGIMKALLGGQSAGLRFTADAADAAQALSGGAIDHVLADGQALALDADAAVTLAELCAAQNVKLTLLWPNPDPALLSELARRGVRQVLAKPISAPDLLAALKGVYETAASSHDIAA